jgi:hypothetical protein
MESVFVLSLNLLIEPTFGPCFFRYTVGAIELERHRGKCTLKKINITWEPGLLLICRFFQISLRLLSEQSKVFQPCSFIGFFCRSVTIIVTFRLQIFIVFRELQAENLKNSEIFLQNISRERFLLENQQNSTNPWIGWAFSIS